MWKEIEVIGSVVTAFSFTIGSVVALQQFYKNNKLRRTDLLNALFEKFFYQNKYSKIRKHLDYSSKHDDLMKQLKEALIDHANEDIEERYVDFFNFFEFIAVLWKLGQLKIKEIKFMFEYYIKMIDNNTYAKQYLEENGFENLLDLINKIKKALKQCQIIKNIYSFTEHLSVM